VLLSSCRYCHKGPNSKPGPCYKYWNNIKLMPEYTEADYWLDFKTMGALPCVLAYIFSLSLTLSLVQLNM
jgi:hypothetical protein